MPNPYLTDEIADLTRGHKQAMQTMLQAAQQQSDAALRAVDLWSQLVAKLTPEEAQEAGLDVMNRSLASWVQAKSLQATAMDAVALSTGTTRKALLDELAALPSVFG